jgi:hypothetical protein
MTDFIVNTFNAVLHYSRSGEEMSTTTYTTNAKDNVAVSSIRDLFDLRSLSVKKNRDDRRQKAAVDVVPICLVIQYFFCYIILLLSGQCIHKLST